MCFSATASFGASVVLSATGISALKRSTTNPQKIFASTPLLFGIQQFSEGCLWLGLQNKGPSIFSDNLSIASTFFLIFAWIIWPTFIPYMILKLEKEKGKRIVLKFLLFLGMIVSLVLSNRLFTNEIYPTIVNHHIVFAKDPSISFMQLFAYIYVISVIFPFFISSIRKIKILGTINVIAFLMAYFAYTSYLVSVWCFFAAIFSIYILQIVSAMNDRQLFHLEVNKNFLHKIINH